MPGCMAANRSSQPRLRWPAFALVAVLLAAWQGLAAWVQQPLVVPGPAETADQVGQILARPDFLTILGASVGRIVLTFIIDLGLALVVGVAAGLSPHLEVGLRPLETAMRAVPTMGVLLVCLIWFESEVTPLVVCSLIVFPLLYRAVVEGVKAIDHRLVEVAQVYQFGWGHRVRLLYLPSLRPFLASGIQNAMGLLWKVMITAEVLSQPQWALGTQFQIARSQLNTAGVLAWSLVVIALAWGLETVVAQGLRHRTEGAYHAPTESEPSVRNP